MTALTDSRQRHPEFAGTTVVVTGAGSGIGAATAREFADTGAHIALLDVNEPAVNEQAAAISADTGAHAVPIVCDVAVPQV